MSDRKIALVTGGSRGIGRAIALKLANDGHDIAIFYIGDGGEAEETLALLSQAGADAMAVYCDVSDMERVTESVAAVRERMGPIDVLVNNAGITRDALAMRMPIEDWNLVLNVNLTGAFTMIKAAMPDFVRRRRGRIINISSVSGMMGNIGQANYSAAKAGLIGLTKTVAKELASRGVTVNAVAPGFVRTPMTQAIDEKTLEAAVAAVPMRRIGEPEDIANAVAFLASDAAAYITGTVLKVDGGMYI